MPRRRNRDVAGLFSNIGHCRRGKSQKANLQGSNMRLGKEVKFLKFEKKSGWEDAPSLIIFWFFIISITYYAIIKLRYVSDDVWPDQYYPHYCNGPMYVMGKTAGQKILDQAQIFPALAIEVFTF